VYGSNPDAGKIKVENIVCKKTLKLLYRGTGYHQFPFYLVYIQDDCNVYLISTINYSCFKKYVMTTLKVLMLAFLSHMSISIFAQDTIKPQVGEEKYNSRHMKYCCPMHSDEVSDKPGKCAKCQREMTRSKKDHMKTEMAKSYRCPMHSDIASNKQGNCSKCGMALKKPEKDKIKIYSCPMHPEITNKEPGKCSICGMELKGN
jgi:Heavy metal binding domain